MEMTDSRVPFSNIPTTNMHYSFETWECFALELLASKEIS